eukprot:1455219-Rhodomonas_salina.2
MSRMVGHSSAGNAQPWARPYLNSPAASKLTTYHPESCAPHVGQHHRSVQHPVSQRRREKETRRVDTERSAEKNSEEEEDARREAGRRGEGGGGRALTWRSAR